MLIENRIKRKIEYEKTDREDKDESRFREELRDQVFPIKRVNNFVNTEKSVRRSEIKQEGKNLFAAKKNPCFKETQAIQVRTKENRTDRKVSAKLGSSSEQEHKVNALASGADEGRDKLR